MQIKKKIILILMVHHFWLENHQFNILLIHFISSIPKDTYDYTQISHMFTLNIFTRVENTFNIHQKCRSMNHLLPSIYCVGMYLRWYNKAGKEMCALLHWSKTGCCKCKHNDRIICYKLNRHYVLQPSRY